MEDYPDAMVDAALGTDEDQALPTARIVVDGKLVRVGTNLEKALRPCARYPRCSEDLRSGLMRCCINQLTCGEEERRSGRVGDIYRKARPRDLLSWGGDEPRRVGPGADEHPWAAWTRGDPFSIESVGYRILLNEDMGAQQALADLF